MSRCIYLRQSDGTLRQMVESTFAAEDLLQELLEKYPNLLAGDQIDGAASPRWLLVARELGVPDQENAPDRWSLDHLFLDQDGVPTLVEVKRSSDTRIRREVVGQMLDYAANAIIYWPPDHLRNRFVAKCEAIKKDAEEVVATFLGGEPDTAHNAVGRFWEQVKTNLQAGKIRLIFVADQIPSELRRIIEFLNTQMDPAEVLAIEVRQFVGGELQTLVPQVIGQTAAAEQKKGASSVRESWGPKTREVFLASAENQWKLRRDHLAALERLLEFSLKRADRIGWGNGKTPGFSPRFLNVARRSLYTVYADGNLYLNFAWLDQDEQELRFRQRLADQLQSIPTFAPKIKVALEGYARLTVDEWGPEADRLIGTLESLVGVSEKAAI